MSLDPGVKALLDQLAANPAPKLWELPPPDGRALYVAMAQMLEPQGIPIGKVENMKAAGPAGEIPVRVYTPMGGGTMLPALVYYHGGGFVIGNLDTHDDAFAALQWVEANAAQLGVDANRLAVAGDSAGGNLAAVVCLMAKQKGAPKVTFQLLIYPTTQAHADTDSIKAFAEGYFLEKKAMDWFYDQYVPAGQDINDPRLSPLAASDLSGLPRAYVVTAGFDPLKDEGKAYADKLNRAGVAAVYVNYDGMVHGFFNMSGVLETARKAIADAAKALREALA